jgi:hypothetical protein
MTPEVLREGLEWVRDRRDSQGLSMEGYDAVAEGTSPADPDAAGDLVRPWIDAGATWWLEADWSDMDPGRVRAAAERRLKAGPPQA